MLGVGTDGRGANTSGWLIVEAVECLHGERNIFICQFAKQIIVLLLPTIVQKDSRKLCN